MGVKRIPRRKDRIKIGECTIRIDIAPGTKWFQVIYKGNDGTVQTMAKIKEYDNAMLFASLKAETVQEIWIR